jgi:predicted nucleotide-binding protein
MLLIAPPVSYIIPAIRRDGGKAVDEKASYSRRTVMKACSIIAHLGHSELTQFFNELGLDDFEAPQILGSRHARAMTLGSYYAKHPDQLTADGKPLAAAIVEHAAWIDRRHPDTYLDVKMEDRADFWDSLSVDGYIMDDQKRLVRLALGGTLVETNQAPEDKLMATIFGDKRAKSQNELPENKLMATIFGDKGTGVQRLSNRIFIVHGRDKYALTEIQLFLRKLRLEPIVLHEQPNGGRTLITKFQEVAAGAAFAVVIMTPDDQGNLVGEAPTARARQNVIFELGFLIGRLGPQNVCALMADGVQRPSDFDGVAYVRFANDGKWERELARELREAGVPFDAGDVL